MELHAFIFWKGDFAVSDRTLSKGGRPLHGKTALITGGASGIGRAIALKFAMSGACIHLVDADKGQAQSTAQEIIGRGGAAHVHECDVSDHERIKDIFQRIQEDGRIYCRYFVAKRGEQIQSGSLAQFQYPSRLAEQLFGEIGQLDRHAALRRLEP